MLPPTLKEKGKYRPDIDGLRAVAIISVVFYHAGFPGFSGGFVGVDVFFVISGFLITSLLFNEAVATGRVSLSAFYARRVRRLMPAGLLVVAVTLLLGGLFMPPASDEQRSLARSALAVAFFGSNFYFFRTSGGYFDDPSFSMPLLHTWSLAIEEQYYLLWPLLMLLVFRWAGVARAESAMRVRVVWVLAGMLLLSLALCIGTTPDYHNFAFYLLPARVWEFALGGIVGLAGTAFHSRLQRWAEGLSVLGLSLIVCSVAGLNYRTPFPGWAAIFPVLGSAVLIVGMSANEHGFVRRMLAVRPLVFIGLLSYSWYLWHWPLLSIHRIYTLGTLDIPANALLVSLALALAWLTYVWIEHPIRMRRPWLFGRVRTTLFAGVGISLATVLMALGLWAWYKHQKSFDTNPTDIPPYQKLCSLSRIQPVGKLPRDKCIHGPDKMHPKVLLWGDSHAGHMMPMLMEAFSDVAVYQLTMAACVPVIGYEALAPETPKYCPEFNRRVLQEIKDLKKDGLEGVVISARWPIHLWQDNKAPAGQVSGAEPVDRKKKAQALAAMQSSLDAMLSTLEGIGVRVVLLAPTPELVFSAPQCLALGRGVQCNVARASSEKYVGDSTVALAEVVSRHPNVRLVQVMDFFCDAQTCFAARDGKTLYSDPDHLTATASRELGRFLSPELAWLRGKPGTAAGIKD